MKYLWLAVISTSLILRAAPVRSQEDANITPDVTTDLPPTVTIEEAATVIPETPTESPEPDPALDPASIRPRSHLQRHRPANPCPKKEVNMTTQTRERTTT